MTPSATQYCGPRFSQYGNVLDTCKHASHQALPFTGVNLGWVFLLALVAVSVGLFLWGRAK